METIHFSALINAGKEKVWHTMLGNDTYPLWTKEFDPGSYYEGSWDKDSEIRFLMHDKDGKLQGMFSHIKENRPFQFISIEHLGMISDGVVDTTSEQVKKWAPSFENYTFTEDDGKTTVQVDMQTPDDYKTMFEQMWPKALQELKVLCEEK